jgi:hypothetical protein
MDIGARGLWRNQARRCDDGGRERSPGLRHRLGFGRRLGLGPFPRLFHEVNNASPGHSHRTVASVLEAWRRGTSPRINS